MDNKPVKSKTIEENLRTFLKGISEGDVYREKAARARDFRVSEQAIKLEKIFKAFFEKSEKEFRNFNAYNSLKQYVEDNKNSPKKLKTLRFNISDIINKVDSRLAGKQTIFNIKLEEKIAQMKPILFFIDSIKLDEVRAEIKNLEETSKKLLDMKVEIQEFHYKLDDNTNKSTELMTAMEKTIRDILPQAIAVLGIFMSILIVLFGGITILESLGQLYRTPIHRYLFSLLGISLLMMNFLFFLVFLIARISKTSINVRCSKFFDANPEFRYHSEDSTGLSFKNSDKQIGKNGNQKKNKKSDQIFRELVRLKNDRIVCVNCLYRDVADSNNRKLWGQDENGDDILKDEKNQCGDINKFVKKYPYLFYINLLIVTAMAGTASYWIIREYFFVGHSIEIINPYIASLLLVGIVSTIFAYSFVLVYGIGKSSKSYVKKYNHLIIIGGIIAIIAIVILFFTFGISLVEAENLNCYSYINSDSDYSY